MSTARDAILGRIRNALHPRGAGPVEGSLSGEGGGEVLISREYRRRGAREAVELLDLLQDRLEDYRATVLRCRSPELPGVISRRLDARGAGRLVTPPGLPDDWLREAQGPGLEILQDLPPGILSNAQLDSAHAVLTG
jgi:L-lactate dehydrogenase complex protein LldG